MTWTPEMEIKTRLSVAHAAECGDFAQMPRVRESSYKGVDITICKHCDGTLWTSDELRKLPAGESPIAADIDHDRDVLPRGV